MIDPSVSKRNFSSSNNTLVGGFQDLKHVGIVTAEKLEKNAPYDSWETLMQALPKQTQSLMHKALWHGNTSSMIQLAPWMPVSRVMPTDMALKQSYHIPLVSELSNRRSNDMTACGYVTYTEFKADKIFMFLEDDKKYIVCRVAHERVKKIGDTFRGIKVGDFVAVSGFWTGEETFFMQSAKVLRGKDE